MSDIKIKTERESKTSFSDLTSRQIENIAPKAAFEAIAKTWEMGLPITTEVGGKMCQKYIDGKIEWM